MALAYMAAAALAWQAARWQPLFTWFVPLGRTALTVYLAPSIVQLAIFSGLGAGLAGRLSLAWLPVITVAILASQRHLARRWDGGVLATEAARPTTHPPYPAFVRNGSATCTSVEIIRG